MRPFLVGFTDELLKVAQTGGLQAPRQQAMWSPPKQQKQVARAVPGVSRQPKPAAQAPVAAPKTPKPPAPAGGGAPGKLVWANPGQSMGKAWAQQGQRMEPWKNLGNRMLNTRAGQQAGAPPWAAETTGRVLRKSSPTTDYAGKALAQKQESAKQHASRVRSARKKVWDQSWSVDPNKGF